MPRVVRCGLIQAQNVKGPEAGLEAIKKAMVDKHVKLIEQAAKEKVRRSSACRSCSTAPTSAPSRRRSGTTSPSACPTGPPRSS